MDEVFAHSWPAGEVVVDVTSVTLANNTAKQNLITVPANTIWVLQSLKVTNPDDVNRVITIILYKEAALTNIIASFASETVATTARLQLPHNAPGANIEAFQDIRGMVLGPGATIWINWAAGGASAGGTDADGQVIFYRRLTMK